VKTQSRWFRALLFGSIYFIEGAILTYFSGFNALYLRSFDMSYSLIGTAGAVALLPFVLKIFIGMLSDRVNLLGLGHRKPFMIIGILLQALGLVLVPLVNPVTSFGLYLALLLLISLGMSTYDTCADGLSIDTTPTEQRGFVQGVMVGARALAAIVLASAMGFLVARVSWSAAFWFTAVITLLPLVLVLRVHEDERPAEKSFSLSGFRSFFTRRMGLFLLLGLIYPLVLYSVNGILGTFLNESVGISILQVGLYTSLFGVGAVVGGLAGGPLTDRLGRRSSLLFAMVVTSVSLFALVGSVSPLVAVIAVLVFGIAFGYYETVYMAAGMDFSDPRIAATMFAIIMAVGNIGIGAGQPLAGVIVDARGFRFLFVVLSLVNLASLPLVPLIFKSGSSGGDAGPGMSYDSGVDVQRPG
jgi:PAT family beta-lactamase induction signal transducer AmpG